MADRKAEKERLRQARIEAEKREAAEQRRKLLLGYGVAGLLALLVIAGIVFVITKSGDEGANGPARINVMSGSTFGLKPDERDGPAPPEQKEFDLKDAAQAAGCVLREDLPDEGHRHLDQGEAPPKYKTNPPTSGNHSPNPLADGAYLDAPMPVNFVHSMEHGRIVITYDPKLPEAQQLALRGLYDTMYSGALMFPDRDLPYAVAAVAWQNFLGCKKYKGAATLDAIRAFGIEHFGEGPEDVNAFGPLTGPTPATPGDDPTG